MNTTLNDRDFNRKAPVYDADENDFDENINIRDSNVMSSTVGQMDLAATSPLPSLMTQYALEETAR